MKWITIVTLFLTASAYGVDLERFTGNINEFADKLIRNWREVMLKNYYDPFKLPTNLTENFWFTFLWTNHTGRISLFNPWIQDISTLGRRGNAIGTYQNRTLKLHIGAGLDDLIISGPFRASVLGLYPEGTVLCSIKNQNVFLDIGFDFCNYKLSIDKILMGKNSNVDVTLSGTGLDWIYNPLTDAFISLFKNDIIKNLAEQVRVLLNSKFENSNLLPPQEHCDLS